jgi:long-chain acyl-CoA synthetase
MMDHGREAERKQVDFQERIPKMPNRTDIIDPTAAKTIAGLFQERVRRTESAYAYQCYDSKEQRFEPITWLGMSRLAGRWQAAMQREKLHPGDRVALILNNCPEWVLFDLAALGLGLVTVPMFAGDRPANIRHILKETGARLVLVQDMAQWLTIAETGDRLFEIKKVITAKADEDDPKVENPGNHPEDAEADDGGRGPGESAGWEPETVALVEWLAGEEGAFTAGSGEPADLATIVYTSGTTGMPKGVMLSHANILENAFACLQRVSVYRDDRFLSFLPLSHTFERTVGYYIPMMAGACVAYVRSIEKLAEDLMEVRPTVLISVPRIYERVHAKIERDLDGKAVIFRNLFRLTVDAGWRWFLYRRDRVKWNPVFLLRPLLKRLVARRLTDRFGGRLRLSISGGAPISFPIARVFIGLGLNFLQGYGLTETSPVISVNTAQSNDPATVGRPLPGVETAIAPNGELLVRGPSVMLGYWQNREATAAALDSEGYFHTGDLAQVDALGRLKIVGRLKEIIVLSTGEKVAPADLELAITSNPLFEQAMVVGEGRSFLAALVVLNSREWEKLAAEKGWLSDRPEQILSDERIERFLLSEMAGMTVDFPEYAQIRRIHASFNRWRIQDGFITHTLKLRRMELLQKFKTEVESFFKGH